VYQDVAWVLVSSGGGANKRQGQYGCVYAKIDNGERTKIRASTQIYFFSSEIG
jgi:hypothetical protein